MILMRHTIDRRQFHRAIGLSALTATVPTFLQKTGTSLAADQPKNDRVLVVIQLGGGNDGLNTLVPFADDTYYRTGPRLRSTQKRCSESTTTLAFTLKWLSFTSSIKTDCSAS